MIKKTPVQAFAKIPNKYVDPKIYRSRSLSLLEEKFFFMILNSVQKRWEAKRKGDYHELDYCDWVICGTVTINEFRQIMEIGSVNNQEVYKAIVHLNNYVIAIKDDSILKSRAVFSGFNVDEKTGIIHYKFNEDFISLFTHINANFFKMSINEIIALNSVHAIKVYQLLKSKLNMELKEHQFSIEGLRKYLNLEKKYALYGHFKAKVLTVAIEQINTSSASQFRLDFEEVKEGSKVVAIKFIIRPKTQNYYEQNNIMPKFTLKAINEQMPKWQKSSNSVIQLMANKINEQLKTDKSRAAIRVYYNIIKEQLAAEQVKKK